MSRTIEISAEDFHWMCGLLEGDGSFCPREGSPIIKLAMTDKTLVSEVANIIGNKVTGPYRNNGSTKDVFRTGVRGVAAVKLMNDLKKFMGQERRQQINNLIEGYEGSSGSKTKNYIINTELSKEKRFLLWLVGFLEAEAWFGLRRDRYLAISVQATAKDCIENVAEYFDRDVRLITFEEDRFSDQWNTALKSSVEAAAVMEIILPYMRGEKKQKIKKWLNDEDVLTASKDVISGWSQDFYSVRAN